MKTNKPLLTIFLVVFIDLMGFGLILPLLPFIAERFNATPQQIGLLAATYSFFQFIAGPILGRLSDRFGRKKLLILSQLGTFAGFCLLAVAHSLPLLFLSRIIDGITGGNISIAQAYIADVTDTNNRAKGMGLIGAAFGLGFIIGPSLGGLLSQHGYTLPAIVAAGVSLISVSLSALFLRETVRYSSTATASTPSFTPVFASLKDMELRDFTIMFFVLNMAFSSFQGIFALWAQARLHWDAQATGLLLGFVGLISVVAQLRILPLAIRHLGEWKTLRLGIPLMASGFLMLALAQSGSIVYLANFIIVLGNSFVGPTLQSLATKEVDKTQYGGVLGIFQSAGSLARIFGPIAAGFIYASHPSAPFIAGSLLVATTLFFLPKIDLKSHYNQTGIPIQKPQ